MLINDMKEEIRIQQTFKPFNLDKQFNELDLVKAYLQGLVYCWIINNSGKRFAVDDLVGGINSDWTGTPLESLFEQQKSLGKSNEDAYSTARRLLGWVLKLVLHEDKRKFKIHKLGTISGYRWINREN